MKYSKLVVITCLLILLSCKITKENKTLISAKKNVLFLMMDDLRPELSVYGHSQISSPNIDALAKSGVTFKRAYCNVPVCGASRASILTGIRPTANRFLKFNASIKNETPNILTLVKHFKNQGYTTISNNKITHLKRDINEWDEEWYPSLKGWRDYQSKENIHLEKKGQHGYAYENPDIDDDAYYDGKTANKSILDLKRLKAEGKPFFMAVGFVKPHLPFNAPKKYWDLYKESEITLPKNNFFSNSAPEIANHSWGELRYYKGIPKKGQVSDTVAKKLIHGYYAAVSYVDAQVGKVLKELKNLGLKDNTVIVLVGDHGWSLMEHGLWVKHSNFRVALQVPLIISASNISKDRHTNSIAELVDLYPTLCELANISIPTHLDGESLVEALQAPSKVFKNTALARWQKGETLVADNLFYTEWQRNDNTIARMLYDHNTDSDENRNLAIEASFRGTVDSLSIILNNRLKKHQNEK
jgi:iduronate 2-sulfatase